MMSRFVLARMAARSTHDRIGSAQRSFAVSYIAKQIENGVAMLPGDDDVLDAVLRLDRHGELLSVG